MTLVGHIVHVPGQKTDVYVGGLLLNTGVYLLQAFQAVVRSLGLDKIFLLWREQQYHLMYRDSHWP